MDSRYAFWIASEEYFDEAHYSHFQFKQKMRDIKTVLFYISNHPPPGNVWFDESVVIPRSDKPWYLQSTETMAFALTDYLGNHAIYFDTDTYLIEPVYELYEMLEHGIEFFAAHAPGRITAKTFHPVPDCFPEFNVGVCGFLNNTAVRDMVKHWFWQYTARENVYGNNDQASLREVLWNTRDLRIATLPPEYNFRFRFGGFLRYPVKVLHGRHTDINAVARSVNAKEGMRVWTLSDME